MLHVHTRHVPATDQRKGADCEKSVNRSASRVLMQTYGHAPTLGHACLRVETATRTNLRTSGQRFAKMICLPGMANRVHKRRLAQTQRMTLLGIAKAAQISKALQKHRKLVRLRSCAALPLSNGIRTLQRQNGEALERPSSSLVARKSEV